MKLQITTKDKTCVLLRLLSGLWMYTYSPPYTSDFGLNKDTETYEKRRHAPHIFAWALHWPVIQRKRKRTCQLSRTCMRWLAQSWYLVGARSFLFKVTAVQRNCLFEHPSRQAEKDGTQLPSNQLQKLSSMKDSQQFPKRQTVNIYIYKKTVLTPCYL